MADGRVVGRPMRVDGLNKWFGSVKAVRDLSFGVAPGRVTGFLGPNGSGKTTTLRCLLGLVRPSSGTALIGEHRYAELDRPLATVGAALEASSFHSGRTARNHLRILAAAGGLQDQRVDEVLEMVGLTAAAKRKVGGYSLGMRQRLALAAALLGDPGVLILDEPANGLDPEGIAWLRTFLRALAAQGRTILVSSHVLSEVQQTVDDVLIINQGQLVYSGSIGNDALGTRVRVRTPSASALLAALADVPGTSVETRTDGSIAVIGTTMEAVGRAAFVSGVELHELTHETGDLERIFLEVTAAGGPVGAS